MKKIKVVFPLIFLVTIHVYASLNLDFYDLKGNVHKVTKRWFKPEVNSWVIEKELIFNRKGDLEKSIDYFFGEEDKIEVYLYDQKGNNIEIIESDKDKTSIHKYYYYDHSNNLIKWETFRNGISLGMDTLIRNNKGQTVEHINYNYFAGTKSSYKYFYNSHGDRIKEEGYDNNKLRYIDSSIFIYDLNGKMTLKTRYNNDEKTIYKYQNGQLISETKYYNGRIETTTYNSHLNEESYRVSENNISKFKIDYEYVYDFKGNWIKKNKKDPDTGQRWSFEEQIITYF